MLSFISNFFKANFIKAVTSVNIKDVLSTMKSKLGAPQEAINKYSKNEEKEADIYVVRRWQIMFPFAFFYGGGKFQPIYFFIFIFCMLTAFMLFVKTYAAWRAVKTGAYEAEMISTADLATVLTFISSLILLYNNNKKNSNTSKKNEKDAA